MTGVDPPPHVARFYPTARPASTYLKIFQLYAKFRHDANEDQIAFLSSVCCDDLNSVTWPKTKMIGPFNQGGLDGYPFAGKTGLGAFSHHIPEDGVALMFIGPHIGITDEYEVGKVVRPGQAPTASDCCGAAAAALRDLESPAGIPVVRPPDYPVDDYQQERIRQTAREKGADILAAGAQGRPERFMKMTEVIYIESHKAFKSQLQNTEFKLPAYYFGGIMINQDDLRETMIVVKHVAVVVAGLYEDLTEDFNGFTKQKVEAFKSGGDKAVQLP